MPAFAALRRNFRGALALALLIAVAVALGVGVTAQERALRKGSARAADGFDLVVGAPGSQTQLVLSAVYLQEAALPLMPGKTLADVAAQSGVAWWAPIAFGDSDRGRPIVGTTAAFVTRGGALAPREGRLFASIDEAVAGAEAGLALGAVVTPTHGHSDDTPREGETRHAGRALRVVGLMPRTGTPWDRAILAPIESVWATHGLPTGHSADGDRIGPPWEGPDIAGVPAIIIKAASAADAYRLRGAYRVRGALRPDAPTMGVFPAEVLVELYATMGDVRDAMRAMAFVTQALVLLAILVAVVAILAGRKREIAVLRALGAPKLFVFATLWLETAVMVVGGALLGLALGYAASAGIARLAEARLGLAVPVSFGAEELGIAAAAAGAGLLLAFVPAALALRQPVAEALRDGA